MAISPIASRTMIMKYAPARKRSQCHLSRYRSNTFAQLKSAAADSFAEHARNLMIRIIFWIE